MNSTHFAETQTFPAIAWILVLGIAGGSLIGLSFVRKVPSMLRWVLRALGIAIPLTFYLLVGIMTTVVDDHEVQVKFGALRLITNEYPYSSIAKAYPRQYDANNEYGGYGMKGKSNNRALNTQGDSGVQLILKGTGIDGNRVLIGSQRSGELAGAINEQLMKADVGGKQAHRSASSPNAGVGAQGVRSGNSILK